MAINLSTSNRNSLNSEAHTIICQLQQLNNSPAESTYIVAYAKKDITNFAKELNDCISYNYTGEVYTVVIYQRYGVYERKKYLEKMSARPSTKMHAQSYITYGERILSAQFVRRHG